MSPTPSLDLQAPNGVKYTQPTGLFINNEFVASCSGQSFVSIDPATEKEIAKVQAADTTDVDKAKLSASDRGLKMSRLADLIEQKRELFATIDAWDNGKSYKEAIEGDLVEAVGVVRYYAGWADKSFGQTISTTHEKFAYTIRQPIGVVAQIIPWNYPLCMAIWKLGPALACGNAIVLKPADQTPLSALVLAELVKEAVFPPGVFNDVNGGRETGTALVQHPLVDKVAFTGSTATAVDIMGNAAKTLKNVTLETGGKSPLLVFEDAELDQADGIYDKFIKSFLDTTKTVSKLGNQWDTSTYQGPLVSKAQYDRVLQYIDIGKKEGATVATGGEPTTVAGDKSGKGFWVAPTVFTDVEPSMRIFREEIFGLVVIVLRFKTEEEAIALANDTTYGLSADAFTTNLKRAYCVA
ncbi:unnamed protein product [Colletotrichum noveboracense]|uniref:Aldehyde dehydrogenase domain-containing protein n=1 Tax=Colletotrichum noveboracense TaxID=2664923 RepID=A0A9W4WN98_9PEZI|nr:unnamed protein product [Colletotrichum noveboracense]